MLGEKDATWGPAIGQEDTEEPHILGEKESSWGPPLGSDEPRVPVIKAEEKASPFFFSANTSFHQSKHPVAKASEPTKKHGFKGFFEKFAEEIKKVEEPLKKVINTVAESAKDGELSKSEI